MRAVGASVFGALCICCNCAVRTPNKISLFRGVPAPEPGESFTEYGRPPPPPRGDLTTYACLPDAHVCRSVTFCFLNACVARSVEASAVEFSADGSRFAAVFEDRVAIHDGATEAQVFTCVATMIF